MRLLVVAFALIAEASVLGASPGKRVWLASNAFLQREELTFREVFDVDRHRLNVRPDSGSGVPDGEVYRRYRKGGHARIGVRSAQCQEAVFGSSGCRWRGRIIRGACWSTLCHRLDAVSCVPLCQRRYLKWVVLPSNGGPLSPHLVGLLLRHGQVVVCQFLLLFSQGRHAYLLLKAYELSSFSIRFFLCRLGCLSLRCLGGGLEANELRVTVSFVLLPRQAFFLLPLGLKSIGFLRCANASLFFRRNLATDSFLLSQQQSISCLGRNLSLVVGSKYRGTAVAKFF